jgi:phosphoribosylformimino-5-aminoimidazole carboxamide ribonucleotide (ProFAR) isomerase
VGLIPATDLKQGKRVKRDKSCHGTKRVNSPYSNRN